MDLHLKDMVCATFLLDTLTDDWLALGILTDSEVQRAHAVIASIRTRTTASPPNPAPLNKIERATGLGTFKLLVGVYASAQVLAPGDVLRLERTIQDAMARNAALHEFEEEDRG